MKSITVLTKCILPMAVCLFLCGTAQLPAREFPIMEKGRLHGHRLIISPDGTRVMLLLGNNDDGKDSLQIDGFYRDRVSSISSAAFSDNGTAVYDRHDYDAGRSIVIVRGRGNRQVINNAREIRINRDGSNFIYLKNTGREDYTYLCSRDLQLGPFFEVEDHQFNAEGSLFGFTGHDKKYTVQVNRRAFGPYDFAHAPVFSRRGGRFAFSYEQDGKHYCRIDEKVVGPFEEKRDVIFSPDGSRYFVISRNNREKSYLYADSAVVGPFQQIGPMAMSDDGMSFAFRCTGTGPGDTLYNYACSPAVGLGRKVKYFCGGGCLRIFSQAPGFPESNSVYVQFNDRRFEGFDDADDPVLDRRGGSIAFRLERKNEYHVRFNEKEYGPFNIARGLTLDDSGKHLVFFYQVRDKNGNFRYGIRHDDRDYALGAPGIRAGLSADGTRFCCVYGNEKGYYLMIDGSSRGPFDAAEFMIRENRVFVAWAEKGQIHLEEARRPR